MTRANTPAKLALCLTFDFEKVQRRLETLSHAYFIFPANNNHTQTVAQRVLMRGKPDVVNHNGSLTLMGVFSISFEKRNRESQAQKQSCSAFTKNYDALYSSFWSSWNELCVGATNYIFLSTTRTLFTETITYYFIFFEIWRIAKNLNHFTLTIDTVCVTVLEKMNSIGL